MIRISYVFLVFGILIPTFINSLAISQPLFVFYSTNVPDYFLVEAIESVAKLHGLQTSYIRGTPNINTTFNESNGASIVFEDCHLQSTLTMRNSTKIFLFVKDIQCEGIGNNGLRESIPTYMASTQRKFPCLSHVVSLWLSETKYTRVLRPAESQDASFLSEEYLKCIGKERLPYYATDRETNTEIDNYLKGKHLIIATVHRPTFIMVELGGQDNSEIVSATGFCIDMLDALASHYEFTYHLMLPPDGQWGSLTKNKSFNGMVGLVQRKEIDMAIGCITITSVRESAIDFTMPFYEDPTTILTLSPKQQQNLFVFLDPYSEMTWIVLAASAVVAAYFMWMYSNYRKLISPYAFPFRAEQLKSFEMYMWHVCQALVAQSSRKIQQNSSRIIYGFWWLLSLTITLAYTSSLISHLTVPKLKNVINSLEELSNQREILWTYRANTAHDSVFGDAQPPGTYYKIGQLMKQQPNLKVHSDAQGVDAVLNKNMAFIKEKSWLDSMMETDYLRTGHCKFSQVKQQFFYAGYGWCLQTDSPFMSLFNRVFLRFRQNGIFEFLKRRYEPRTNECNASRRGKSSVRTLSLNDLKGHFLLMGFGFLLSFMTFLFETFYKKVSSFL